MLQQTLSPGQNAAQFAIDNLESSMYWRLRDNDSTLCTEGGGVLDMLYIHPPDSTAPQKPPLTVGLFPNPANDYAIIQLSQSIATPLQLKITGELGKVIMDAQVSFSAGIYNINTSAFSSGIYFVNLYDDSGKIFDGKLCIFSK